VGAGGHVRLDRRDHRARGSGRHPERVAVDLRGEQRQLDRPLELSASPAGSAGTSVAPTGSTTAPSNWSAAPTAAWRLARSTCAGEAALTPTAGVPAALTPAAPAAPSATATTTRATSFGITVRLRAGGQVITSPAGASPFPRACSAAGTTDDAHCATNTPVVYLVTELG
jgi:hypothetical protein